MSKISKKAEEKVEAVKTEKELHLDETVMNFMGGDSYKVNPLHTLELIASSSIFGEPKYYGLTDEQIAKLKLKRVEYEHEFHDDFFDMLMEALTGGKDEMSVAEKFERAIDASLDFNFKDTLLFAERLRKEFNMRLNPQVIMVRAAMHPKRREFTNKFPGLFGVIEDGVMQRADEPMTQLAYFLYMNGGKKSGIPTILKKAIAKKLSSLDAYQVNKYKNHEIGMIDSVRLSHANSEVLNELMKTGKVIVGESKKTWEQMRSGGASWTDILKTTKLGHMALLRNLCGIFKEIDDENVLKEQLENLKGGVLKGKQFPFRYYNAYCRVLNTKDDIHFKPQILDALEECLEISLKNLPHLKGRTMCLSDNSGSAWGQFTSEYGKTTVAVIDNLSSVIAAKCSDEGYVGKFGDKLLVTPIKKTDGVLSQAERITEEKYMDVGGSTEGGIWEFFDSAIKNKEHYDNIFIFSDQQAGTGGLYGTWEQKRAYESAGYECDAGMVNVFKLITDYRKKVNPKVNVYSIQTGGYDNALVPENSYRTSFLYGWTGKETLYADTLSKVFDKIDEDYANSKKKRDNEK